MFVKHRKIIASILLSLYLVVVLTPLPVYASVDDYCSFDIQSNSDSVTVTVKSGSFRRGDAISKKFKVEPDTDGKVQEAYSKIASTLVDAGLIDDVDTYMETLANGIAISGSGSNDEALKIKNDVRIMGALLYYRLFPGADLEDSESYGNIIETVLSKSERLKDLKSFVLAMENVEDNFDMTNKLGYSSTNIFDDNGDDYKPPYARMEANNQFEKPTNILNENGDTVLRKKWLATLPAINIILEDVLESQNKWAADAISSTGWETNPDVKAVLKWHKGFNDLYSKYFPFMGELWKGRKVQSDKIKVDGEEVDATMENICKATGADNETVTADDYEIYGSTYTANYDQSTPIGNFYILNSKLGITSYDRDKILGDAEVNKTLDDDLQKKIEDQRRDTSTIMDERLHENENINTSEDGKALMKDDSDEDAEEGEDNLINTAGSQQGVSSKSTSDVDADGLASSTAAVTMSDYIVTGMSYSTTYVPMRTNLYSTEVISSYDQTYRDEFYYKYGFMRKALFIDDSATAAVDYYNANGKFTGTRSICTLRNLIESDDRDVVLYIDPSYYNTEAAIKQANEMLTARRNKMTTLASELSLFAELWSSNKAKSDHLLDICNDDAPVVSHTIRTKVIEMTDDDDDATKVVKVKGADYTDLLYRCRFALLDKYKFNTLIFNKVAQLDEYITELMTANNLSAEATVDNEILKTGDFSTYSTDARSKLSELDKSGYINLTSEQGLETDSTDTIVLNNADIQSTMSMETEYKEEHLDDEGKSTETNVYTSSNAYSPMLGFAYSSILYRNSDLFTLANTVTNDNPVFIASDKLCAIEDANQWYRNSILNTILLRNLESGAQVDYNYVTDLDSPVYMDVIGNIVTQSGIVVIPAASNATLHSGLYHTYNLSVGTYVNYGKDYSVPVTTEGAYSALTPFFVPDLNSGYYVINNMDITLDGGTLNLSQTNQYSKETQTVVMNSYKNSVVEGKYTNLNWMAMVNIANEVMRGATIDQINMDSENINSLKGMNKAGLVAAAKLESLINSLKGVVSNTLLKIPDFSRMDSMEFFVAFFIKLMIVATTVVVIFYVYRDGVSNSLGLRTLYKSLAAIALTFSCIVIVPSIFQLTYYTANKLLLQNESMRILMLRTDTNDCGVEIGVTENYTPERNNEFAIQLDWLSVPWYKELEDVLYKNSYENLKKTKLEAYSQSPIYDHSDVTVYDDGIYVTTDRLFDSVRVDYTFNSDSAVKGLYMYSDGSEQTAGFYSPYYAFLRVLLADVNEYNARGSGTYNYTTKYISGNRLKTVGLCYNYFTSTYFMGTTIEENDREADKKKYSGNGRDYVDNGLMEAAEAPVTGTDDEKLGRQEDIMHIYQIYSPTEDERQNDTIYEKKKWFEEKDKVMNRASLFSDEDRSAMAQSLWYNQLEQDDMAKRVELMDEYAREFVANNRDLLNKVTDETFIKVMALNMAIKYNQLFGVRTANAIEIYNMDSNDILRLSIADHRDAVVAAPMSFARFVYNFGGEASVYVAAVLEMIMWVGSFIKPICTILVFVSVFMSIFVFRVVLRRPSHNLWGYLITVLLLSATNVAHAVLIKLSMKLPSFGLPTLGCLIFVIFAQVSYLLFLGFVTGISLKDWYNLGASEYAEGARKISSKFSNKDDSSDLSGSIKHHANNWDYYNDLVKQHRSRNA